MANKKYNYDYSDPRINVLVLNIQNNESVNASFSLLKEIFAPLITSIINKYVSSFEEDVIQEANLALWESAMKFDVSKGAKFSTFASVCISGAVLNYINSDNQVAISKKDKQLILKVAKAISELEAEIERTPSVQEILDYLDDDSIEEDDIVFALNASKANVSFDKQDKDERSLSETIAVSEDESKHDKEDKIQIIEEYLEKSGLTDIEKTVIINAYGLKGHKKMSISKIAKDLFCGVPRQKIESTNKRAIAKIKKKIAQDKRNTR